MEQRWKQVVKLNNRGLTLVELILVMAISAIVIGAITIFMSAGSRSYKAAENEILLQTEAQTIMNQIRECVLEGNNIEYDAALGTLFIYHSDDNPATTADPMEIIWFNDEDKRLYLYNLTIGDKGAVVADITAGAASEDNLLGEYVESFSADPVMFTSGRPGTSGNTLTVTVRLEYNDREFSVSEDIKLRNRIVDLP